MSNLKISVIIPAYNVENYISKAISSVLIQSHKNIEVVVVNDGSTDLTKDCVNKMIEYDQRIKLINQKNAGVAIARNTGLENATGDYIAFVDADDWIDPLMFEKMIISATQTDADIVMCDYFVTRGNKVKYIHKNKMKEVVYIKNTDNFILDNILLLPPSPCNKLYKRQIFNDIKYPKGKIFEDFIVYSHLILSSNIIAFINEPLYYYYLGRTGSIMSTKDATFYNQIIKQHYEKYNELLLLVNRDNVNKVNYMRLHKYYFSTKKKYRNNYPNVYELLQEHKSRYTFTFKDRLLLHINKNFVLRPLYKLRLKLRGTIKK